MAVRLRLAPQAALFQVGEAANRYYIVEWGSLLVHRRPFRGRPAVTFAKPGSLLIYDCAGTHVADCHATRASIVLAIDRRRLELSAMLDPVIAGALRSVHANELGMILRSLGVQVPARQERHRADELVERREQRRASLSGRQQAFVDRATGRHLPPSSAA
jgi:CRP-like cAMP-binding protein